MNNKGFTLVEVIAVIALLGLLVTISVPGIMRANEKAKERTLLTKIENIEKAAVLYGQDNRHMIKKLIQSNETEYKYCFKKDGTYIENCYYYLDVKDLNDTTDDTTIINVEKLINPGFDSEGKQIEPYINADKEGKITNPTNESKNLNNCEIQIYQKYGKIYAVYNKEKADDGDMKCWK